MDYELFKEIVDEASRYGRRSFSLHLFGEPLLYPKIVEAIQYIKRKNRHHTVLLTTNGTLLNRYVDGIIAAGIDRIVWTWRPEAKFTDDTIWRLKNWKKFAVRIIRDITPPEEYERWKSWRPIEIRDLHNYGSHIDTSKKMGYGSAGNSLKQTPTAVPSRWPCYHLWLAPAVAWNGEILICCSDPHRKEKLGTFPSMSVHQAWTSEKLNQIRDGQLNGIYGGICKGCDVWKQYPDIFFKWQKS